MKLFQLPEPEVIEIAVADYIDQAANTKQPDIAFINSVAKVGLIYPLVFTDSGSGLILRDGKRRIQALSILKIEKAKAYIYKIDGNVSAELLTGITNMQRSRNEIAEYEMAISLMDNGATKAEICKALFIKKSELEKLLKLGYLIPDLLSATKAGKIKITTAYQAAVLSKPKQTALLVILSQNGKITGKDVLAVKDSVKSKVVADLPDSMFDIPSIDIDIQVKKDTDDDYWKNACEYLTGIISEMVDAQLIAGQCQKEYPELTSMIREHLANNIPFSNIKEQEDEAQHIFLGH